MTDRKPRTSDNWCVYRTPFDDAHPVCGKTIDWKQFQRIIPGKGYMGDMPCLGTPSPEAAVARCASYERLDPAALKAKDAEMRESLKRVGAALAAIKADGRTSGEIACPSCPGRLFFSVARSNGHVHARCTTDKCTYFFQ